MGLDLSKLQGVKRDGTRMVAQCPACAAAGHDQRAKNHLIVYPNGRYGCVLDQTPGHYREIWQLAGTGPLPDGEESTLDTTPPPEPEFEIDQPWDPEVCDLLIKDHSYWVGRGVREDVLDALRGGVATAAQMANRYVFPIFNDDGMVAGFAGRALWPHPEKPWKNIGNKRTWIWGGLEEVQTTRQAILVEGAGCRLALDSRDIRNSLVLWGVTLSQAMIGALITANPTDIVIATNRDVKHSVGQQAAARIKETLSAFFDDGVVRVVLPEAKDFLDMPDEAAWDRWLAKLDAPAAPAVAEPEAAESQVEG